MAQTPAVPRLELAKFKSLDGSPAIELDVHFNPVSLQYTIENQLKEEGQGSKKKQHVSQTSAKLTMDLVFDTTDTGNDVRSVTDRMAKLLQPVGSSKAPRRVEFGWGAYSFAGLVEQYRETLDYFSPGGVPLRSSINLTMASQDVSFESSHNPSASVDGELAPEPVNVPAPAGGGAAPSAASVANQLRAPRSARAIAEANGAASLRFGAEAGISVGGGIGAEAGARFGAGASAGFGAGSTAGFGTGAGAGLSVGGGGVTLAPAAAFSAGASAGAGAGMGVGAGARIGAGAGAGAGLSASAGAGVGAAAGGAFAGLRAGSGASVSASIPDPRKLIDVKAGASVGNSVGGAVQFAPGGRALSAASGASLGADVGASADLSARLRFS